MSKQKITILIVAGILVVTAIILGAKIANKDSDKDASWSKAPKGQVAAPKDASSDLSANEDPELKELEAEINSISDADLSEENLSDQNLGL